MKSAAIHVAPASLKGNALTFQVINPQFMAELGWMGKNEERPGSSVFAGPELPQYGGKAKCQGKSYGDLLGPNWPRCGVSEDVSGIGG
jgi:hypothetical protein